MKIGIDLDNTIIDYANSFLLVAKNNNFINKQTNSITKESIKKQLLNQTNGQKTWEQLQGLVYGKNISLAEIYDGFNYFLEICRLRNVQVDIVSHKTIYAHHDQSKVNLRIAALDFLKNKKIITSRKSPIKNIFFCDTKIEKLYKISEGNYDYFIDDLKEILLDEKFPSKTKKILFSNSFEKDLVSAKDWGEIRFLIFNKTLANEYTSILNANPEFVSVKKSLLSGGNSKIYIAEMADSNLSIIKEYQGLDSNRRKITEFDTLLKIYPKLNTYVPKPINVSSQLPIASMEYISGETITSPSNQDLIESAEFIKNLFKIKNSFNFREFKLASAAILSPLCLEKQLIARLNRVLPATKKYTKLDYYVNRSLAPSIHTYIHFLKSNCSTLKINYSKNLTRKDLILSPSDFGFHNSIKVGDKVKFIDFEYFGWDDPVKLICDFLIHPAMNLDKSQKEYWLDQILPILDKKARNRFKIFYNGIILLWCMIVLNEYIEEVWSKRVFIGKYKEENKADILNHQLIKSMNLLENLSKPSLLDDIFYDLR